MKSERFQVFEDGLLAGLIGYATVVLATALVNIAFGRSPFHTAALLGSALFYGLTDPDQLTIWAGPVLAYNGVHLIVFMGIGLVASWLAHLSEKGPDFWYIGVVLMMFIAFHLFSVFMFVGQRFMPALSPWMLLGVGLGAMVTIVAYFVAVIPTLRSEFRSFWLYIW